MTTMTVSAAKPRRLPGLHGTLSELALRWRDHREAQRAKLHLKGLDDRLMRDIGLPPNRRDPAVDLLHKARLTW
ncbi:DUF1127 domain-containing protein [Silicimonas algicola]|uniref:Uncharacterized protein DUF1127 n=1 Tax=Silicimonas algicola TaxID=1826607 RepID=A0A316G123_9RHOB|nr:DUF1127 domain-containing protein [Silicimonas algicola]PWK53500.1 uncharacterized protein DUF1127 [Silicimonas algicola]